MRNAVVTVIRTTTGRMIVQTNATAVEALVDGRAVETPVNTIMEVETVVADEGEVVVDGVVVTIVTQGTEVKMAVVEWADEEQVTVVEGVPVALWVVIVIVAQEITIEHDIKKEFRLILIKFVGRSLRR